MTIRTGIGGWTYPDWRGGTFYPEGLRQADELSYAARHVGAIEINGTFYRLQKPENFAKWRDETPDGFVFTLKGSRFVTNRRDLSQAGESVEKFVGQGIVELGDKLGPLLWQLAKTKRFDPDEIRAFLALLPAEHEGVRLRHAIEVGHESFACAEFVDLARAAGVAIVWSEDEGRAEIADRTADFAYLRCQRMRSECPTGYDDEGLDRIARMCRAWAEGRTPQGLPHLGERADSRDGCGDVFAFMISQSRVANRTLPKNEPQCFHRGSRRDFALRAKSFGSQGHRCAMGTKGQRQNTARPGRGRVERLWLRQAVQ